MINNVVIFLPITRYIDAKEPIRAKLLFLSPIRSRKGAFQLKPTLAIDSDIKRWVKQYVTLIAWRKWQCNGTTEKLWDKNQTAIRSLMMQIFYNAIQSSLRRRTQTITQHRKQAFSNSLGWVRNCFWYFVNNLCGRWLTCISQTELYVISLFK